MFSLCKYKNILGVPNQGVHSYRFFHLAIVDVLLTFLLAFILAKLFRLAYFTTLVAVFLSGIVLHRLFCVRTTIDKWLFP
jgi:hypothetical protein